MTYSCAVCGYDGLEWRQYLDKGEPNFVICGCCGFQSGFHDLDKGLTLDEYRKRWVEEGAKWFDISLKPNEWDLKKQLARINVKLDK